MFWPSRVCQAMYMIDTKMRLVPPLERTLVTALRTYLPHGQTAAHLTLSRFMHAADVGCWNAEHDPHYIENPINSYHTLRRLVIDWDDVIAYLDNEQDAEDFSETAQQVTSDIYWPSKDDLHGSMIALDRLVHVYDLDLGELSRGRIRDTQTAPLRVRDVVMIGDQCATVTGKLFEAAMWYNVALDMVAAVSSVEDGYECSENVARLSTQLREPLTPYLIYKKIAAVYEKFGATSLLRKTLYRASRLNINADVADHLQSRVDSLTDAPEQDEPRFERINRTYGDIISAEDYTRACQARVTAAEFCCEYRNTLNPLYKVKAEYLHRNPDVIRYHDLIFDNEMEYIKVEAFKRLHRSLTMDHTTNKGSPDRISESAWLDDRHHPTLDKVTQRIHAITGLEVGVTDAHLGGAAEFYQVLNYGLGGQYDAHFDAFGEVQQRSSPGFEIAGNRIATMALYLTDVQHGGATVFPKINATAFPIKGTGVFWWNLHRNGDIDDRSLHAGCPVLIGDKWFLNKWMRHNDQFRRKPCALDKTL